MLIIAPTLSYVEEIWYPAAASATNDTKLHHHDFEKIRHAGADDDVVFPRYIYKCIRYPISSLPKKLVCTKKSCLEYVAHYLASIINT